MSRDPSEFCVECGHGYGALAYKNPLGEVFTVSRAEEAVVNATLKNLCVGQLQRLKMVAFTQKDSHIEDGGLADGEYDKTWCQLCVSKVDKEGLYDA